MTALLAGILFPASLLETQFFQVLALFVAFNTLTYVTLAIGKMLPRPHLRRMGQLVTGRPSPASPPVEEDGRG